jgi:5-methylcytosine-specific restriction endonuclease McrA
MEPEDFETNEDEERRQDWADESRHPSRKKESSFSEDWDEAMLQARAEEGYSDDQFVPPNIYQRMVRRAKKLLAEKRNYEDYISSDTWAERRTTILKRDNHICYDCRKKATCVHHLNYDHFKTKEEMDDCVSLCESCHEERHK